MHRAVGQWLLTVCALWVAGLACGKPPVESELTVAFEQPLDGQRLAAGEDQDAQAEGFQYEVAAVAADTSGRQVTLAEAKLEVRTGEGASWEEGPAALVEGPRVRFPAVTLRGRTQVLRVSVVEEGSRRTATRNLSVTVGAEVAGLELVGPAEGQVLREVDDADPLLPGYQVDFALRATGLRGASGLISCAGVCGVAPVPFTVGEDGEARARVTLSEPVREAQASQCVAVVKRPGGDVTSPARGVTFDTEGPRLALASPVSAVASTTFQVEAVVRSVEDGALATLSRSGAAALTAPVRAGLVTFPEVAVPADGSHDFQLSLTDSGGNVTEEAFTVVVASAAPSLSLRVPASVSSVEPDQPAQAEAGVTVNGLPVGTEVELWTTVTGRLGQPQRARTEESGAERVARFPLSLAEGDNTVKACVRNAAGAQACQLATTRVQTGRPSCRIVEPSPGEVLPAGGAPVTVRVEALDNNGPVSLSALGPVRSEGATGTASGGSASLSLALAGDGAWKLVASCPGGGVSQALTVHRDTTPPALALSVRDAPEGRIGPSFVDTSSLPGTQVVLDALTEPFARVLLQGCGLPATLSAAADGQGRVTLREVTVPDSGSCSFSARAVDLAGNEASVQVPVVSAFGASTLSFTSPDASRTLGTEDGTPVEGGLSVPVSLAFSSGAVGELKLYRDTSEVAGLPVAAEDSAKSFPGVQLAEGINVLRAVLVNGAGAGACASALYTVDTTPGAISLTAPGASSSYTLREDRDSLTPGIQRPLAYALNGASASATVDVCTSVALTPAAAPCRDGSGWFTLASGVPAYSALFSYPDGKYSLKVVLDDGGLVNESAPVSLVVDGVRPEVIALEFKGDLNGDRHVNAAEWPVGAPVLRVSTAGLELERPIQVRDAGNNTLYGQAKSAGALTEVPLDSLPPGEEADYSLVVVVTDAAGNVNRTVAAVPPNPLDPINAAALTSFRLDRLAPEVTPTAPNKSTLGPSDDADGSAAGFQLRASVTTSADVGAGGVSLSLEPVGTKVSKTPEGRAVSHDFTVADTGTRDYMLVFSARDASGNVSPSVGRPVRVDLEAPVLSLVSPTSGSTLDSSLVSVRVDVVGGQGLEVVIFTQLDGGVEQQVGSFTVVNGVAQGSVNLPDGTQTVTARAVDAAGNSGSASATSVTVKLVGCDVTLTSPSGTPVTFNRADDRDVSSPGLQYRLSGRTTKCPGRTVTLSKGLTALGTTTADPLNGTFSFDVSLPDAEQSRLTVEMVDSEGNHTNDFVDYTVDITPPAFASVSPSATALTYVSASNVNLPGTGYVQDLTAGGDADAEFRVEVSGAAGGRLRVLYRGTELKVVPVATSPETLTIPLVLAQDTSGPLELKLRDTALNETVYSVPVTVDVLAPAQVAFTSNIPADGVRKAWVDLAWTPSGDDGTTGTPVGYDLRWSTDTLLPGGIPDEVTYYGPRVRRETGKLLPPDTSSYRLTLPPLAKYFIEVRARDEVGNVSAFRAIPALDNVRAKTVLTAPPLAVVFGFVLASGDLDGDGKDELVTGDFRSSSTGTSTNSSALGNVHVYDDLTPPSGAEPVTLRPPTLEAAQLFGTEVAVGNVGDMAGEGHPDVLVGSPGWSSYRGRAFIYMGWAGQPLKPSATIEFRGRAGVGATNFGWAVRIIPDLNGDGLSEVLISADRENTGKGKVYLFFGRSRADWVATATGLEADDVPFIPVEKADRIFEGELAPIDPYTSSFFGRRRGQANVGDLDGDGKPEFALSVPFDRFNLVYLYPGSTLLARTGATEAERTLTVADALQTLTRGPESSGGLNGFGVDVVGSLDFTGGAAKDLVVSQPETSILRVFSDGGALGFVQSEQSVTVAPDGSVTGKRFFGYSLASADINEDGLPDLIVGEAASAASSAWVLYNQGAGTPAFDPVAGDGFAQSRFKGIKSLGLGVGTGDFNGDGSADVAAGDPYTSPGTITVWY